MPTSGLHCKFHLSCVCCIPLPGLQAVYQVDDLPSAISNTAQTQLKEAFGRLSFTEALASQQEVNENMNRNFSARFHQWGITVHRIELQDMKPKGGACSAPEP